MPDSHLWIPSERIRYEDVVKGGGGDAFRREDLADHSRRLRETFNRSMEHFRSKADVDIAADLIVEISTTPARPIHKERQHLRNLGFELIALSPEAPNVGTARIASDRLPRFSRQLGKYADTPKHIGKSNFAAVEEIRPVRTEQKIEPALARTAGDAAVSCLISVYGSLPQEMKEEVARRVQGRLVEQGKRDVGVHRYANGAVAVSAELTRPEMDKISEQFMFVRSIESNADVITEAAVPSDPVPTVLQIDTPRCKTPVAVIDSGVDDTCSLLAGLVTRKVTALPAGTIGPHLTHGMLVASRVVYGDGIQTVLARRASPWCPIIDVQVTGMDTVGNKRTHDAATLCEVLQEIVPALADDTKVFNLSLGLSPVSDGFFSATARLLDYLSRKHQVLFIVSAGNIEDPCATPPQHFVPEVARIRAPGESLLSQTIGSVAHHSEQGCISTVGEISPFSRRGPGADRARKPELVAHGGNALFDGTGFVPTPRTAVYGLNRDGTTLAYMIGTSFAAPVVAQYAARLFDAYPDATPNLVRALLCHFTRSVTAPTGCAPVRPYDFCGFGEPEIDQALFATRNAATFLYQGVLRADKYLFIPFLVPQALAADSASRLTIRSTVVFDPPVSLDDSVNYSFCRVAAKLRKATPDGMREFDIGGDDDDLLHPWNPLLHFGHAFRHGYAAGEWELRLRLMTRGDMPEDFEQQFAVVIEVIDSADVVDVRSAVEGEAPGRYAAVALRIAA